MDLSTTTVRRTVGGPATPAATEPRWVTPASAVAGVAAVAAAAVGVLEARLPVGPGGSSFHHVYPFVVGAIGLGATLLAGRTVRRYGDRGWLRLLALGGVGYTLNALVIAALMYAVTPQGAGWPLRPLAWVEGWLWMPFDVIMFGLLVLLLPGVRGRGSVVTARVLAVFTGLGMLLNAFAQTQMENTDHIANPLAIPALAPLGSFGDLFCLVAMMGGALAAVVRHVALLVRRDPAGRRVARIGLPLALLVVVVFVVQGALTTETAPLAANLVAGVAFLVAGGAIALAGTRLAARTRDEAP